MKRSIVLVLALSVASAMAAQSEDPCGDFRPQSVFLRLEGDGGCSNLDPRCGRGETVTFSVVGFGHDVKCGWHRFDWRFSDGTRARGLSVKRTIPGWPYHVTVRVFYKTSSVRLKARIDPNVVPTFFRAAPRSDWQRQ